MREMDTSKLGPISIGSDQPTVDQMIRHLEAARANGNPNDYIHTQSVAQAHAIAAKMRVMRDAMQEFVDRVDKGEVHSKRTYAKFKEILG